LEFEGGVGPAVQHNRRWRASSWPERYPIEGTHLIEKEALKINELEQALIENQLSKGSALASDSTH